MRTTNSGSEYQSDIWFISCAKGANDSALLTKTIHLCMYASRDFEGSRHLKRNTLFQLCLQVVLNVASLSGSLSTTVSNSFRSVFQKITKTKYRQNSASTVVVICMRGDK